jgi:hypothetical protein
MSASRSYRTFIALPPCGIKGDHDEVLSFLSVDNTQNMSLADALLGDKPIPLGDNNELISKPGCPIVVYFVSGQPAWEGKTDGGSGADG